MKRRGASAMPDSRPVGATRTPRKAKLVSEASPGAGVAVRRAYATATPVLLVLDGYPSQQQADLMGPNGTTRRWGIAAERERIHTWVKLECDRQQVGAIRSPARATYTFVVPDHIRRDWDNYALMCKPVQDGLVKSGVLPGGDHWEALEGNVRFRVEKGQRRLEITMEAA